MTRTFPHRAVAERPPLMGLIVLQSDETIEQDFRRLFPADAELLVNRVPSGIEVTPESLSAMEAHLGAAAGLFPHGARFAAMAYACTSGTAQIGASRVAALIRRAADTRSVTDPVTALVAACRALDVSRLALLSPYTAAVSDRLRGTLAAQGIDTPAFGSFDVAEEARVARIDTASIAAAARALVRGAAADTPVDALFLSCTNLRTLDLIEPLEDALGLPVLSSNQVLAWHLARCTETALTPAAPGRINRA